MNKMRHGSPGGLPHPARGLYSKTPNHLRRLSYNLTHTLLPPPPPSPDFLLSSVFTPLLLAHLGGHLGVVLLEALGEARVHGHGLLHAAGDAAALARGHGPGCEVVDAGHEAVVDQVAEELREGGEMTMRLASSSAGGGGRRGHQEKRVWVCTNADELLDLALLHALLEVALLGRVEAA